MVLKRWIPYISGTKKFVSVLEIKDYVLVIGVGEKEMSLLTRWKKEVSDK